MDKPVFQHNPFYKYRFLVLWASFFYIGLGILVLIIGHLRHLEVKATFAPYYESHECDDPGCSKVTAEKLRKKAIADSEMAEKERVFREKKQKDREEKRKRKDEEKRLRSLGSEENKTENIS